MKRYRFKGTAIVPTIDGSKIQIGDKTIFSVSRNTLIYSGEKFVLKAVTMKEVLASAVELTHNSKLYPSVALPCTNADISRLYTFFNKKVFDNECPPLKDVDIKSIRSNARSAFADAMPVFKAEGWRFRLRFSVKSMTTVEFFCNVVIHEMIHLLHQKRAYTDGDVTYRGASHGPLFVADMKRINALGYNVLMTVDTDNDLKGDLQQELNVVVIGGFEAEIAFYSHDVINVKSVLDQVRTIGFSPSYYYQGISTDSKIPSKAMKLTDKGLIGVTFKRLVHFTQGAFSEWVNQHGDTVYLDATPYMQAALHHLAKDLDWPWEDYKFRAVRLSRLPVELVNHDDDDKIKYFYAAWSGITDAGIKRSQSFKNLYNDILQHDMDNDAIVDDLVLIYSSRFKGRVEPERYADLCVAKFDIVTISGSQFKKALLVRLKRG